MSDPLTLLAVAGGTMAAGSLLDAGAQVEDLRRQQAAADFNATVLDQQARETRRQAGFRQEAQARAARKLLSRQRAALQQSGAGLSGTAGALVEEGTILAELDKLALAYEGQVQARGYLQQASAERFKQRVLAEQKDTARLQAGLDLASVGLDARVRQQQLKAMNPGATALTGASLAYLGP